MKWHQPANPGRYLNAAAPLIVKSTRPRRLAGHERHAVPVGPQLEEKAVRVVASLLRTGVWQGESGNWIRNWRSSSSSFFCGSRTISATRTPPGGRERGPRTACWPWKRSPGNGGLPGNEFPFFLNIRPPISIPPYSMLGSNSNRNTVPRTLYHRYGSKT